MSASANSNIGQDERNLAPKRSPLEQFARWFHQDFFLQFPDVETGGAEYLRSLRESEQHEVLLALEKFIAEHPGQSEKGLRNAWLKLGAEAWPSRGSTRAILQSFLSPTPNKPFKNDRA